MSRRMNQLWNQKISFFCIIVSLCLASMKTSAFSMRKAGKRNPQESLPSWIVNYPRVFFTRLPASRDVRNNPDEMKSFLDFYNAAINGPMVGVDGENVDVVEHFFWGLKDGVSIELGALDGSVGEGSMTYELHGKLNWNRIIIEADPVHKDNMKTRSPDAYAVNAAICKKDQTVHFSHRGYVGGILEFMSDEFMKSFAPAVYNAGTPPGNLASIEDWAKVKQGVTKIKCIPISKILDFARINHVDYFLLDVEGAELEVLESFNFDKVTVDVLSIETEAKFRPEGYGEKVVEFMKGKGYEVYAQIGRNHWFTRKGFIPMIRPGLKPDCWNGFLRFHNAPSEKRKECDASQTIVAPITSTPNRVIDLPSWIVNFPPVFGNRLPASRDVRSNPDEMKSFLDFYNAAINGPMVGVDGENVDVVEHFFWGLKDGVSIELGALDGSVGEGSMTYELHGKLNWNRIIIEADPVHKSNMKTRSPDAYAVNAAICKQEQAVHFSHRGYVGGILEFMSDEFMKSFAPAVYNAGTPPGNLSSIQDWRKVMQQHGISEIKCIPIAKILRFAHIRHINYFLLDVEGAELEVLESFNFDKVTVDVLSIETEAKFRPEGYGEKVVEFMKGKGYEVYAQIGRNHWFIRKGFIPMIRPGLKSDCWNGVLRFHNANNRERCVVQP